MIFYLVIPFSFLINCLPDRIRYWVSGIIMWFLYSVLKYRVDVVRNNLANSFPELSANERKEIEKKFYSHLADTFIEILCMPTIRKKTMSRRMNFVNYSEMEQATEGQSTIAMVAHYGSWEYTSSYAMYSNHEDVYGIYRPLSNKAFDKFFLQCRSRFGSVPIPMNDIAKQMFLKRRSEKGVTAALIADQAPPYDENGKWFDFMNQPTQFFTGGERLAMKMNLPIYYTYVERIKRGYYVATFEMIYDGKEKVEPNVITGRYVERLEKQIKARPEIWMWSHRRWKRNIEAIEAEKNRV